MWTLWMLHQAFGYIYVSAVHLAYNQESPGSLVKFSYCPVLSIFMQIEGPLSIFNQ